MIYVEFVYRMPVLISLAIYREPDIAYRASVNTALLFDYKSKLRFLNDDSYNVLKCLKQEN